MCLYETAYGVRPKHDILREPNKVSSRKGVMKVLKKREKAQKKMGAAFTNDTIFNSIDAELIALGDSGKGPNRGAIVRHGPYTIWGYLGEDSDMTETGKALFVNTCFYATKHANSQVLEKRLNQTRDGRSARFPAADRPYIRVDPKNRRKFEVDELAKQAGIPNHKKAYLKYLIKYVSKRKPALEALERYTGITTFGAKASKWKKWFKRNADYLWFSDCEGFKWKIDEQAKARKIKTQKLRGWSSEEINYKYQPKKWK